MLPKPWRTARLAACCAMLGDAAHTAAAQQSRARTHELDHALDHSCGMLMIQRRYNLQVRLAPNRQRCTGAPATRGPVSCSASPTSWNGTARACAHMHANRLLRFASVCVRPEAGNATSANSNGVATGRVTEARELSAVPDIPARMAAHKGAIRRSNRPEGSIHKLSCGV
jgi:hypothetical protein